MNPKILTSSSISLKAFTIGSKLSGPSEHGYTEPQLKTLCFMRLPSTYGILRTCLQTAPAPEKKVEHPYEDFKERVRSFWITNILTSGEGAR